MPKSLPLRLLLLIALSLPGGLAQGNIQPAGGIVNKSSSAGVGVTVGFGQNNGISFQLSASQAKGQGNGSETTWDNTRITASDSLSLKSGADTTLKGAQLAGQQVNLKVGGDLLIETLQDQSQYQSRQSSSGFSLSLCIPPICYGTPVTGSVSLSKQTIDHNYLSAIGQSGIAAGAGGFAIEVGGHSDLIGAAITGSSDAEKNSFKTGGLSFRDLINQQETKSQSSSFGFGYSGASALATAAANAAQNVVGNLQGQGGLPKNGSEQSATRSVISPAQITITGSGDAERDAQSRQNATTLTSRDAGTANQSLSNSLTLQQAQEVQNQFKKQQESREG